MNETLKSVGVGLLMGVGLAVVFAAGFVVRDLIGQPLFNRPADSQPYALLPEVAALVEQYHLRPAPDPKALEYAAVRGLLSSLNDPNSYFIEPPQTRAETVALAGVYGGVGIKLQRTAEGGYRMSPFDNSPAQLAGIQDGDLLLAIDGVPVSSAEAEVEMRLRGEVKDGAGVTLSFRQNDQQREVFVPFGLVEIPSVFARLLDEDPRMGYLQITDFSNRTPGQFREAIQRLRDQNVQAFVIDLRNNGGGLLQEALQIAGEFVDGQAILIQRTRDTEQVYSDEPGGLLTDLPLVVLVNHGTASASEVVVGAIRDYERGLIIGQKTYGKGTIQQIFGLSDNSSIHVTYAEWLTPQRRSLDGQGIEPDIVITPDPNAIDPELAQAIQSLSEALN